MFSPGTLIYFNEFYFKNGNSSKPKYFVVLAKGGEKLIIASLPTRGNHAPSLININHGCVNLDDHGINCYVFEANRPICANGFGFPLPTFIYGDEVEDYEITLMEDVYRIEGIDYEIIGELVVEEFAALLHCFKNSGSVKRKIKKFLAAT